MRAPIVSTTMAVAICLAITGWAGVAGAQGTVPPPTALLECLRIAVANQVDPSICQLNFKCYNIANGSNLDVDVELIDQFERKAVTVRQAHLLCTPTQKCIGDFCGPTPEQLEISNVHLKCYKITPGGRPINQVVTTVDQFETDEVKVQASQLLCEGALKNPVIPPSTIP